MWNDDVRQTTKRYHLSAIVQAQRFSLFGHTAQMPDKTDTKKILTASPMENWRRPLGHPCTIQQNMKSNNLSLNEAIDVAHNPPLCRLMSTFGAKHSFGWDLAEI